MTGIPCRADRAAIAALTKNKGAPLLPRKRVSHVAVGDNDSGIDQPTCSAKRRAAGKVDQIDAADPAQQRFGNRSVLLRQGDELLGLNADHRHVSEVQPVLFDEKDGPFFGDDRLERGIRTACHQSWQIGGTCFDRFEPFRSAFAGQPFRVVFS